MTEPSNKKLKMLNAAYVLSVLTITMTTVEYILKHMDEKAQESMLLECLADEEFDAAIAKDLLKHIGIPPTLLSSQINLGAAVAVEFLILNGAPLTADSNGWTPLHLAVSLNKCKIVDSLLDYGNDIINSVDNIGNNALSYGLLELEKKLDKNIIESLFDDGIDLHHRNQRGKSALDYLRDYFDPTDLPFITEMCDSKLLAELRTKLSNETILRVAIQQQLVEARTKLADEISKNTTIQQQLAETQSKLSEETCDKTNIQDRLTKIRAILSEVMRNKTCIQDIQDMHYVRDLNHREKYALDKRGGSNPTDSN